MQPSATLEVSAKAKALAREGKPIISFGSGEPDFTSPPSAMTSAKEAIDRGETHYTPATGIPELKEAVADYYARRFGLKYSPQQVLIGAGAKPLIYEALGCLVDPGDEVLVFAPAWVSYVEQIKLCDGKEVVVDTSRSGFLPDLKEIRAAISDRTVGMMINTPNNPTGAVYSADLLKGIAKIALDNGLWIIYDEIYERLTYDGISHSNIVQVAPETLDRTIIINGVSKAYAMTGWRIGYALGPKDVITKMGEFQGHLTSNPTSIAQWAALGAIKGAEEDVKKMVSAFASRRKRMLEMLNSMPHIKVTEPKGAFYVFVDIKGCLGKRKDGKEISDDVAFCQILLGDEYLALVPGSAFLAPGYVRLSYANSMEEIEEGMKRLDRFLNSIR